MKVILFLKYSGSNYFQFKMCAFKEILILYSRYLCKPAAHERRLPITDFINYLNYRQFVVLNGIRVKYLVNRLFWKLKSFKFPFELIR